MLILPVVLISLILIGVSLQTSWNSLESASAKMDETEAQREEEDEAAASGRRIKGTVTLAEEDEQITAGSSGKKARLQTVPTYAVMDSAGQVAVERADRTLNFAKSDDVINGAPHLVSLR